MLQKTSNSFGYAWRGLRTTWDEEYNFRIETVVSVLVIFCIFFFHFSFVEAVVCILSIMMVLTAEIINTAIEDVCDKIEPAYDTVIGKIKDTTSAFVLVSCFGAFVLGVLVFWHHFL